MATTWSSDHSTIHYGLQLRLARANDLSLAIGSSRIDQKVTLMQLGRIDQKVTLMQLGHQFNSYNLVHNQESSARYKDKPNLSNVVRCTGAYLDSKLG
jgi:hypothetical protein